MKLRQTNPARSLAIGAAAALALATVAPRSQGAATVAHIPMTLYPAAIPTVTGISSDGSVLVGNAFGSSNSLAYRWTSAGGLTGIDPGFAISSSSANGVSADGSAIVGTITRLDGTSYAYRWTNTDGVVNIFPDTATYQAHGVSANGSTVVGVAGVYPYNAFRWTKESGMTFLFPDVATNPNRFSVANAVNADGSVVVGSAVFSGGEHAFLWTNSDGMIIDLGSLGEASEALGVSEDGSVIAGNSFGSSYAPDTYHAFRWTSESGMTDLGLPDGSTATNARANTISSDGVLIGGSYYDSGYTFFDAFIWDETHGMRDLQDILVELGADMTGWDSFSNVSAIGYDGVNYYVAGNGQYDGSTEIFIATLPATAVVPEPAVCASLLGGLAIMFLVRRSRFSNNCLSPRLPASA